MYMKLMDFMVVRRDHSSQDSSTWSCRFCVLECITENGSGCHSSDSIRTALYCMVNLAALSTLVSSTFHVPHVHPGQYCMFSKEATVSRARYLAI